MKIAYFDCFSGAAGDMINAALLDAGLDFEQLKNALASLPLKGYDVSAEKTIRCGVSGTRFDVHIHKHSHDHDHHHHDHHHGRHLPEVLEMIDASALLPAGKENAKAIFNRLAKAEGQVHGKPPEKVHFHEVGAVDSIVDIVGAAAGLSLLGIDAVYCSPFRLGTGTIHCAHGEIPVPAPATANLLQDLPVVQTAVDGELTTPSGAAILSTTARDFGPMPPCRIQSVGYGAGTKDIPNRANVLRVFIGETTEDGLEADIVEVIEANVDDMSPEFFGGIFKRLLRAGALDVSVTPVQMKKGRSGFKFSAIAPLGKTQDIQKVLFTDTTTFGVRIFEARRSKLPREKVTVQSPWGPVTIKLGRFAGQAIRVKPEHDDCARLAEENNLPFDQVYEAAMAAFRKL